MAIVFDANSGATAVSATPTVAHTATGANRFAAIGIYANADDTISAISYGAQTPTLIQRFNLGFGTSNTLWVFGLVAPATGAQTVSATLAAGSNLWGIGVCSYTGVHQSVAYGSPATAEFSGAATVTVDVAAVAGDLVIDFTMSGCASAVAGAGQAARMNTNFSGDIGFRIIGMSEEAGVTTTTMSWALTSASSRAGIIGVALKPAATGGLMRPQSGVGSGGMQSLTGGMQGRAHVAARNRIFVPPNFRAREFSRNGARPELRA